LRTRHESFRRRLRVRSIARASARPGRGLQRQAQWTHASAASLRRDGFMSFLAGAVVQSRAPAFRGAARVSVADPSAPATRGPSRRCRQVVPRGCALGAKLLLRGFRLRTDERPEIATVSRAVPMPTGLARAGAGLRATS
jgi:hypothetical protein